MRFVIYNELKYFCGLKTIFELINKKTTPEIFLRVCFVRWLKLQNENKTAGFFAKFVYSLKPKKTADNFFLIKLLTKHTARY